MLSPCIDELLNLLINNLQKDKDDSNLEKCKKTFWIAANWFRLGVSSNCYKNTNKAVALTQKTHVEVEQVMQYFEATYAEIGELIGDTFSDKGETFNNIVWPKIRDNLCAIWNRFFKDIEIVPSTKMVCAEVETNNPLGVLPNK